MLNKILGQKLIVNPISTDVNQEENQKVKEPFTPKTALDKRINTPKFNEVNNKNTKSRNTISETKSTQNKRSTTIE